MIGTLPRFCSAAFSPLGFFGMAFGDCLRLLLGLTDQFAEFDLNLLAASCSAPLTGAVFLTSLFLLGAKVKKCGLD